ncbi:MAG: glycoside hydrolase family 19 protein [Acidobacteria bacterium]|nr:glycoside hydrolase family 19 protein [Acidobacteriota bacterium]
MQITRDQILKIMPTAAHRVDAYLPHLNKYMPLAGMNTVLRAAFFLAQCAHESGEFRYTHELASGEAYDTGRLAKQLGNTPEADGDGQKFKGRGAIEITGADNYRRCSIALFGDARLLDTPDLLEEPEWGVAASCWFWTDKMLNSFADRNDFIGCTRKINPGLLHLAERQAYLTRAIPALT